MPGAAHLVSTYRKRRDVQRERIGIEVAVGEGGFILKSEIDIRRKGRPVIARPYGFNFEPTLFS